MSLIQTIAPADLKVRLEAGEKPFIVDVREDDEVAGGIIPGAVHIRLGDLPDRFGELPKDRELIVVCRGGNRSLKACEFLADQGYSKQVNLTGGMREWAQQLPEQERPVV
ncbi:rhodanese-like domain-containing protein [Paenibacillus hodogayensis]|uniref:Rhodanese-like domain-containing protein n=1 Tax=Paenibacillus hodogayensis TaxID=279208 RepID=A0ABV5VY38_9BACL